jgi:hypothetical protein
MKESMWVCLCIPLSLLGNNSVKKFPWQRKIVGGIVFYAFRAVSRGSRRLVLPRTLFIFAIHFDHIGHLKAIYVTYIFAKLLLHWSMSVLAKFINLNIKL